MQTAQNMFSKEIELSMDTFINVTFDYLYLPPELVGKIYSFVIGDYYERIIYKHCYNYVKIQKNIDCLILYCIRPHPDYIITDDICIESLLFLVNTHIPRKYDLNLWAAILRILSTEIYTVRYTHRCNNISFKSPDGKKLKLVFHFI